VNTDHDPTHRLVEVTTMALYVSIALLAALLAVDEDALSRSETLAMIWGTAVGLAVAHYVAFSLASALARGRRVGRAHLTVAGLQFLAAIGVAAACTLIELVIGNDDDDAGTAEFALAVILGVTGYLVSRGNGASRRRAIGLGMGVLTIGIITAVVKNILGGH
jgi:hypothetical protein